MRSSMTQSVAGLLFSTLLAAGAAEAQDRHGPRHHGGEGAHSPPAAHTTSQCPHAGMGMASRMSPGMMGAQALLERADELELDEEQREELKALAEDGARIRERMRELHEDLGELLTPEQLERMRDEMMPGPGPHRMHRGPGAEAPRPMMPGMHHPGFHREGRSRGGGPPGR